jgi:hypothetical protein
MQKADGAVKPYVKSISGVTLRDVPVFKRLLAIVQRVVPARVLGLLRLQRKGADTEGKAVPVQVAPKRQTVRSAPPPTPTRLGAAPPRALGTTPPKALPNPPAAAAAAGAPEPLREEAGIAMPLEIEKAGQEVINTVGDFFKNMGGSVDNLLAGEKEKEPKRRGIIIAWFLMRNIGRVLFASRDWWMMYASVVATVCVG